MYVVLVSSNKPFATLMWFGDHRTLIRLKSFYMYVHAELAEILPLQGQLDNHHAEAFTQS